MQAAISQIRAAYASIDTLVGVQARVTAAKRILSVEQLALATLSVGPPRERTEGLRRRFLKPRPRLLGA